MTMISSGGGRRLPGRSPLPYRSRQLYYVRLLRALNREITAGKIIGFPPRHTGMKAFLPLCASCRLYYDENAGRVSEWLEEMGLPMCQAVPGPRRHLQETKANVDKRKAEGCIAVEMECAGMQAVCDFRGLDLYYYLISGDLLDCEEWDMRILGDDEEKHQLKNFYIALEMALKI